MGYDKFEQRSYLKYCNGAKPLYSLLFTPQVFEGRWRTSET